ncbi:hypothetical protein [Hydrogenophaga sp.]|uniref:hypothetical protein n=1 Tax=Hydrogenophaga sp. TaxID=1904254 RepID=UPI0025C00BDE|nr:hypothetical protein [Hydrogenophaga sp.]
MKTMKWRKLGLIFSANGQESWMSSHAAVPFAEHIFDDLYRIFFTTRDSKQRSHLGYIDINLRSPLNIINISSEPVIKPGSMGEFDDSGAMGCWITKNGRDRYLYYQGWNLGVTIPFRNSIGLAISHDGEDFARYCPGPILDRTMFEPQFCATPCVLIDEGVWKMWYLSCTKWILEDNKPKHKYHLKYAESTDGIVWRRNGHVAIDYSSPEEYAISRPSVIKDIDCWRMWYSYRGDRYRIGYAESQDGKNWIRMDSLSGIDFSTEGWDSEMIEYPFVFDHSGHRYMLYNGNEYGKTGFGLAVLDES